jgi:hypothetical protein
MGAFIFVKGEDNLDKDKVIGIVIIITVVLINFLGILAAILTFFKGNSELISGSLSFIGSIIGGMITYIGVKMTLQYTSNEKILEKSNKKIKVIENCLSDIKPSYQAIFLLEGMETEGSKNEILKKLIISFNTTIQTHFEIMRDELDYEFIGVFTFYVNSLNNNIVYRLEKMKNPNENVHNEGINKIQDIYTSLDEYKKEQIAKYYEVKNKQNKLLL